MRPSGHVARIALGAGVSPSPGHRRERSRSRGRRRTTRPRPTARRPAGPARSSARSPASAMAENMASSSALRLSGRLRVTSAMPSSMEIWTRSDIATFWCGRAVGHDSVARTAGASLVNFSSSSTVDPPMARVTVDTEDRNDAGLPKPTLPGPDPSTAAPPAPPEPPLAGHLAGQPFTAPAPQQPATGAPVPAATAAPPTLARCQLPIRRRAPAAALPAPPPTAAPSGPTPPPAMAAPQSPPMPIATLPTPARRACPPYRRPPARRPSPRRIRA